MHCYFNTSLYYTAPDVDGENVKRIVDLMTDFYKFTCDEDETLHLSKFHASTFFVQIFDLRPYQSRL